MRRIFGIATLSLALTAGTAVAAPPALAAGMACAEIVAANLNPGGGSPNYITVRNCGGSTQSWRYNLNSTGWKYVSIAAKKQKTTNFPANWARLDIEYTW